MARKKRWAIRDHIRFHESESALNVKLAKKYAKDKNYNEASRCYADAAHHASIAHVLKDATRRR